MHTDSDSIELIDGMSVSAASYTVSNSERCLRVPLAIICSTTTIITGYQTINYRLRASKDQSMLVVLASNNGSNYFNIYQPGKGPGDEAMFIGSMRGNRFDGILPADGEYIIQIFLMRNAARRNENANYTLNIQIGEAAKTS